GFELGCNLGELELNALKTCDRFRELSPLLGVVHRTFEGPLRDTHHLSPDPDTPFIQGFDGDLVALAHFSEYVFRANRAILEDQFTGRACSNAELVLFLADCKTREITLNQKRCDPSIALFGSNIGKHNEHARFRTIGDPELAAVQHPFPVSLFSL